MKKHITLLCDHNITHKPRSSRILMLLDTIKADSKQNLSNLTLHVISKDCTSEEFAKLASSATFFTFPKDKSSKERSIAENAAIHAYCQNGAFEKLIFTPNRAHILPHLYTLPPQDMLIIEDITLLPFATRYKQTYKSCHLLIDLREFYPLEYENDEQWREGLGQFFTHLCRHYLPFVDTALSVSEGLCERYKKDFRIPCTLFYSLPPFFDYTPKPTDKHHIKSLYHGFISPDRSSMELLDLAKLLLNSPYTLYVMALSNQKGFLESFRIQATTLPSIKMIEPVSLEMIIPTSSSYDIGLIPFKPTTFNLAHCMPNKLFEYLQARLALLCTPLDDISNFIKAHQCGTLTQGFESADIATTLLRLSPQDIDTQKAHAHTQAQKWHIGYNRNILENLLHKVLTIDIK